MITRMRTGEQEHIKRAHKFYCIGVSGRGRDGVEGCVLKCTTVYFVAAEAYYLAESAGSIAIPIHCVASGTVHRMPANH